MWRNIAEPALASFAVGAWGTAIFSNDTSSDVRTEFRDLIADGLEPREATDRLVASYEPGSGADDAADFWLGLALAQHRLGRLLPDVHRAAVAAAQQEDLRRWEPEDREKRVRAVSKALDELASPATAQAGPRQHEVPHRAARRSALPVPGRLGSPRALPRSSRREGGVRLSDAAGLDRRRPGADRRSIAHKRSGGWCAEGDSGRGGGDRCDAGEQPGPTGPEARDSRVPSCLAYGQQDPAVAAAEKEVVALPPSPMGYPTSRCRAQGLSGLAQGGARPRPGGSASPSSPAGSPSDCPPAEPGHGSAPYP